MSTSKSNSVSSSNGDSKNNSVDISEHENKNDELLHFVIQHLKSKGLHESAATLKNEINQNDAYENKNEHNHNHNKDEMNGNSNNGHSINRKRRFSEMNNDNDDDDKLLKMYKNYSKRRNNNNNSNNNEYEQVMSTHDFSLQSFGSYQQLYEQKNKCQVSNIAFSADGSFTGIGCVDGTVRIFEVNKLHQKKFGSFVKTYDAKSYSADIHKPLIATLNINALNKINEIDFHPNHQHLTLCQSNGIIKFYEFHKNKNKKLPINTISECFNIKTVQYHPSGNYIIAGGDANYVRIYDIKKEQGYIAKFDKKNNMNHDNNFNQIRWSLTGNIFASCSSNGSIKLYDGRNMQCVNTLSSAHKGLSIHSIRFSKNCKYLLSSGGDDIIRLCDLRVGKECMNYRGCKQQNILSQACFTYNDEHVISYSDVSNRIFVYDTNYGNKIAKFKDHAGNNINGNFITYLATSPTEPAFMCASKNDFKNRFYATIKRIDANDNKNEYDEVDSYLYDDENISYPKHQPQKPIINQK